MSTVIVNGPLYDMHMSGDLLKLFLHDDINFVSLVD